MNRRVTGQKRSVSEAQNNRRQSHKAEQEQPESFKVDLPAKALMLGDSRLAHPANAVWRAQLFRAGQRALGNRAVQRLLRSKLENTPKESKRQRGGKLSVKRKPASMGGSPSCGDEQRPGHTSQHPERREVLSGGRKGPVVGTTQAEQDTTAVSRLPVPDHINAAAARAAQAPNAMMRGGVSFGPGPRTWEEMAREGWSGELPAFTPAPVVSLNGGRLSMGGPVIQRKLPPVKLPAGVAAAPNWKDNAEFPVKSDREAIARCLKDARRGSCSEADGKITVYALTQWLEKKNVVQYSGQPDIWMGSPLFVRGPSPEAQKTGVDLRKVQGFTFGFGKSAKGAPLNKVEIYPRALMGESDKQSIAHLTSVIGHEFIHVLQNRKGGKYSDAQREFQAYLWQAFEAVKMGIPPRSRVAGGIWGELRKHYGNLKKNDMKKHKTCFGYARFYLQEASRDKPVFQQKKPPWEKGIKCGQG